MTQDDIYSFLKKNPEKYFNTKTISIKTNINLRSVCLQIRKMGIIHNIQLKHLTKYEMDNFLELNKARRLIKQTCGYIVRITNNTFDYEENRKWR